MPIYEEPVKTGAADGAVAAMRASFNSKNVGSMASEAKKMLDSAKSGGFLVSPEAAQPIMDTFEEMKKRIESLVSELENIAAIEPPLGDHDYGKRVALHQQSAFSGEKDSPVPMLGQLHRVLFDAHDALKIAVSKYSESESAASDLFKGRI